MQGSQLQLDMHDASEPNVLEQQHLPDTEVLSEGYRGCLQVCMLLNHTYTVHRTLLGVLVHWFSMHVSTPHGMLVPTKHSPPQAVAAD